MNIYTYCTCSVYFSSTYQTILLLFREALDKAEKATQKLATVSKDVIKALEIANPKETKK